MTVRGQDRGLPELLMASVAAAQSGDHATSWRLTSEFGTRFWLTDPDDPAELPTDLPEVARTEFHVLRAAAADRMELYDETIAAIRSWRTRAETVGDTPSAVLALSSLCLVSMVIECDNATVTSGLAPSAALLTELAARITDTGANLTADSHRHARVCLSLATMAGLTCATSTENTGMRRIFRNLADQFTTSAVDPGDRILTEAQQLHADGQTAAAVTLVTEHLSTRDPRLSATETYEAHDLLGFFALTAGDGPEEMDAEAVLSHWRICAELALDLGAPLEGVHRAEQVCQLLNAAGDYEAAHDLARRYQEALDGAPVCPALLNLRTVRARAALGTGLPDEAFALAAATADWSAMTPDTERTLACLSIAAMAAEEVAGAGGSGAPGTATTGETVVALLERAASLHLDRGEHIAAAQVLRTGARERCTSGDTSRAVELMERAMRILEESTPDPEDDMLTWHLADWNEDMSVVWEMADRTDLAVSYAERAARLFRQARDHSGAALNWVSAAELYLDQGNGVACDRALDRARTELTSLPAPGSGDGSSDTGENAAWEGYQALRDLRQR